MMNNKVRDLDWSFELVSDSDQQIKLLYELLESRIHNISHSKMPSFQEHKNFVLNMPYRFWYLVFYKEKAIGSFYAKYDNSVGLNLVDQKKSHVLAIFKFLRENLSPKPPEPSLVSSDFHLNVSSNNQELLMIFDKLKLKRFQVSYKI